MSEFDRYEIAFLTGGAARVARTALVVLCAERRVRVSRGTHRVQAVRRDADDPVQAALLALVPGTGILLDPLLRAVAACGEVSAVADGLREAGLLRPGLRGAPRLTRAGRAARRRAVEDVPDGGPERFAALGPSGLDDAGLRTILQTKDPKPVKLPRDWAKNGTPGINSTNAPERTDLYSSDPGSGYY